MGVGKYSPTVSASYAMDQKWWERNGGGHGNGKNPESGLDDDGYDSYGYSGEFGEGEDRAGYTEEQYMVGEWEDDDVIHPLYDRVSSEWTRKLLGDLNDYMDPVEIQKTYGIPTDHQRLYLEFIPKDTRMIYGGVWAYSFYIHKDDVEKVVEMYRKYLPKTG